MNLSTFGDYAVIESDILEAYIRPGFSARHTQWCVFIGKNRWLRQKVKVHDPFSPYHRQELWFWAKLSQQQFAGMIEIIEAIGFREFDQYYQPVSNSGTDRSSQVLTIRWNGWYRQVEMYGEPWREIAENRPEVMGFHHLWETIMSYAPFEKVPIERGLPRPWWRFW